jgi:hypothetical protein
MGLLDWGFYFLEVTGNKLFELYDLLTHPPPLKNLLGKRKVWVIRSALFAETISRDTQMAKLNFEDLSRN